MFLQGTLQCRSWKDLHINLKSSIIYSLWNILFLAAQCFFMEGFN